MLVAVLLVNMRHADPCDGVHRSGTAPSTKPHGARSESKAPACLPKTSQTLLVQLDVEVATRVGRSARINHPVNLIDGC